MRSNEVLSVLKYIFFYAAKAMLQMFFTRIDFAFANPVLICW